MLKQNYALSINHLENRSNNSINRLFPNESPLCILPKVVSSINLGKHLGNHFFGTKNLTVSQTKVEISLIMHKDKPFLFQSMIFPKV